MDHDDDEGVGFISQSHYLKSPTTEQQAMSLLKVPSSRDDRETSISSSVSDLDVPIYSSENLTTRRVKDASGGLNSKLAFAIAAAALGSSFQHGYNTGVLNSPQTIMEEWMKYSLYNRTGEIPTKSHITVIWSIIVSIFCIGGMIGGAITGLVADKFGRKGGLLLNNIFVVTASILEGASKAAGSYEMIIIGRLLIGINSGLNAGLTPMYLSEIAPINLRGAVGTVYQLVITISILIAQILGVQQILGTAEHWPVLLAITVVPGIYQLVTLPFCPESPKYLLLTRGKEMEAQRALTWLRGTLTVHEEMDLMRSESEAMKLVPKVTVRELITNHALRIPLIISLMLMIAQQLSGINAVMFFSTKIFELAGLTPDHATYATMAVGLINVFMTVVSMILVERCGRKTLLLIGFAGMTLSTLLLTMSMKLASQSDFMRYLCIILVLLFVIMFATGPGSIPWFMVSELFTQSARPAATSLAVAVNWAANFIVGIAFLPLQELIGSYVFLIFSIILALNLLFIYKKVPETKNKTMEEISAMFRQQSYN